MCRLRPLLGALALLLAALACNLPIDLSDLQAAIATATPTLTPTPSFTPTITPTPTQTSTPTPVPAARVGIGDHYIFLGDWEAALHEYQAAFVAVEDPEIKSHALLGQGRVYFQIGDLPRALRTLREMVEAYPESPHTPHAYYFLGQVFTALDRYDEAAEAYSRYLETRPGVIDAYIYELRGDAYQQAGNLNMALADFQQAVNTPRSGNRFPLEIKLAGAYAQTGDWQTALIVYQDIYNRSTNDFTKAQMLLFMGRTYAATGQTEQAYATYLQAVENHQVAFDSFTALVELVNAGYPVSELDRGVVDYHAAQYGVALAALDRYLNSQPGDPEGEAKALYYRGLIYRALGQHLNAIQDWDALIQNYGLSAFWSDAWEQKGYTLWAFLDRYPEAVDTFLGFVNAAPAHPRAVQFLDYAGRVAERSSDLKRAAAIWDRVSVEYPTAQGAHRASFLAGITYYRLGAYESASITFQRALTEATLASERAAAYLWIGKCHQVQGRTSEALSAWTQAAYLDATGYYSVRARDLILNRAAFQAPLAYDFGFDEATERAIAEGWLRVTFNLPAGADLSAPGPLGSDPRVMMGTELWNLGLYELARLEFEDLRQAVQDDAASSYRLGVYMIELGLYRSGIIAIRQVLNLAGLDDAGTLTAPRYFNRLRFGPYYAELIIPEAQKHGFHPLLLFSLARQESLFEGFVRSSAGARGVMQIIPSTGQGIVDRLGWPPEYTAEDLYRPTVSIILGSDYLAKQRDFLGGDLYAALAAYNGGPGNANVWKQLAGDDQDLFLEIIRFDETRRYIRAIYEIYSIYYQLYDRSP
jgi:soluble lytic murein transglycosylase